MINKRYKGNMCHIIFILFLLAIPLYITLLILAKNLIIIIICTLIVLLASWKAIRWIFYYPRNMKKYSNVTKCNNFTALIQTFSSMDIEVYMSDDLNKLESMKRIVDINYTLFSNTIRLVLNKQMVEKLNLPHIHFILAREVYSLQCKKEEKSLLWSLVPFYIIFYLLSFYLLCEHIQLFENFTTFFASVLQQYVMVIKYSLPAFIVILLGFYLKFFTQYINKIDQQADVFGAKIVGEKTAIEAIEALTQFQYIHKKHEQWHEDNKEMRIANIRAYFCPKCS